MIKSISSLQNPLVKQVSQLLDKSRERKKTGLFVAEGKREIELAHKSGYEMETVMICPEIYGEISSEMDRAKVIHISFEVYQKLAYRKTTEGIIAVLKSKAHSLEDLDLGDKPLLLVAEAPEKPGNIGALLRTADAADLDAVIIANPRTDLYNPNIIRSSVGCLFTRQIAVGSTEEIIEFLKKKNISIFSAALQASKPYHHCDFTQSSAIVVGTEADGLSSTWIENSDQNVVIPMRGEIDSMNVSVAAGILIFEASRQRNFE